MLYFPDSLSVVDSLPTPLIFVIIVGFILLMLWVVKQWSKGEVDPKKHWKSPSQSKPPTPTKRPFDRSGRPYPPEHRERSDKPDRPNQPEKRERPDKDERKEKRDGKRNNER